MSVIGASSFLTFCKGLEGQKLATLTKQTTFHLDLVKEDGLYWTVDSTKRPRYSKKHWIIRYLDYYSQTGSLCVSEYCKNIKGTEASYILPLIKLYQESKEVQS
jgi:hypothetical protein